MANDSVPRDEPLRNSEAAALEELRTLIIGPEQRRIEEVRETLQNPSLHAEAVGVVLPDAIRLAHLRDQRLGRALAPSVESALKESIQRDPIPLADAIFPIIGPAIRRSIAASFREITQTVNRTLEHSLSIRGLRWRLEAFRTGRPFAEVVIAHTLIYRVEQVLLVHNETSLLLAEVHAAKTESRDADQISAMLAAIQDFMRDSFHTERQDGLNTVEFGELTLWLERGPRATLIAAIRGHAPEGFRPILQQVTEEIHATMSAALVQFEGDNAPFARIFPDLERCLVTQLEGDLRANRVRGRRWKWTLALMGLALVTALGYWYWRSRQWQKFDSELAKTEGILVTQVTQQRWVRIYRGLRDPLAEAPEEILKRHELPAAKAKFELAPFWSLTPDLIYRRTIQRLAPPIGVTLTLDGETLRAKGSASSNWVAQAQTLALALPGIGAFDASGVLDPSNRVLAELSQRVEAHVVQFTEGTSPVDPKAVENLARDLQLLTDAAVAARQSLSVEILGHTDRLGTPDLNQRLGTQRAQAVVNALVEQGLPAAQFRAAGRGSAEASIGAPTLKDRRVTVRVALTPR